MQQISNGVVIPPLLCSRICMPFLKHFVLYNSYVCTTASQFYMKLSVVKVTLQQEIWGYLTYHLN